MRNENIILPGQTTCTSERLQGAHVGNMILPSPSQNCDIDFPGGSSRKRKSAAMDPTGATPEYCFPMESNTREVSPLLGLNGQGNNHRVHLNRTKSIEPVNFRHHFENDQLHYQSDFSETWSTSYADFHRTGIEKTSNAFLSVPPQSLQHKEPLPLIRFSVGETLALPNQQPRACHVFGQIEAHGSLSFSKSCNAGRGKSQVGPDLQDLMSFGIANHVVPDKVPLENCNILSDCLKPEEILHQIYVQPNRFSDGLNGRTCPLEDNKFEISCELKRSDHFSNTAGIDDFPTVGTVCLGASVCTEQNVSNRAMEKEVQFGTAPLDTCLDDTAKSKERNHGDGNIKLKEITVASDTEKPKYSLTEDCLSKNEGSPDCIVGEGQKNDPNHGPLKLDEKSELPSEKAAATVAEKLWDGSLQLNSSVTVSSVAFFKSGEKLLDVYWSEFVEVKGKVRLEAFEKYIQDLPRSRNRGLMVISLCWKEGSPEIGLTGMKEVAKGYRKGGRVGFAQLSPGIDLYICPRSEAIITILAKYGFFKGMAAVEDNQDSLIGCVVWRRNRTSSNPVAKKTESKNNSLPERPLNSPSGSFTQQIAEKKLSPTQPAQQSAQSILSVTSSATSAGENGTESKNIESCNVKLEVSHSSSDTNTLLTYSVPSNSYSIPVGQQTPAQSYSPLQGSRGHLLEVEASHTRSSGTEQPKVSLGLQNQVISVPSNVTKQTMRTSDDDDLPEYDFGTACGISTIPINKPLDSVMPDKRLQAERIRNMEGLLPSTMPVVQEISVSNKRSDNLSLPRIPSGVTQEMPPPRKVGKCESRVAFYWNSEEKNSVQSKATPTPVSVTAFASLKSSFDELNKKKNLFDDDDDLPEWCPPELHKQPSAAAIRPSTTLPSYLSKSTFQNVSSGPHRPLLPSPPSAATHSALSSQAFRPAFHCPTTISVKAPQPFPFESHPCSSMGFNSNPIFRPHSSSYDVKFPFQFGDRRGRRP